MIRFTRPYLTGKEAEYIQEALKGDALSGDHLFTKRCHQWLEEHVVTKKALLTPSCTAALEMAAILADIQPGDEVIMPSYTFVSTANAFVLRGATPVFVDIREDTLNIDETLIEAAITEKTKAIVPVHYAGVGCEMDAIMAIANKHNLIVIEDAAQGVQATYKGRPLGSIGHMGCFSFHDTKNISCGEGGALLINDERFLERAEIIREKGTNRSKFFRGQVDKYTWVDLGSSYLPSEITAAHLFAQLEASDQITQKRLAVWNYYNETIALEHAPCLARLQPIHRDVEHNAHMFYVLTDSKDAQNALLDEFKANDIYAVFHYIPLHSAPAGQKFGRVSGTMKVTDDISARIIRLPLWPEITKEQQDHVVKVLTNQKSAS